MYIHARLAPSSLRKSEFNSRRYPRLRTKMSWLICVLLRQKGEILQQCLRSCGSFGQQAFVLLFCLCLQIIEPIVALSLVFRFFRLFRCYCTVPLVAADRREFQFTFSLFWPSRVFSPFWRRQTCLPSSLSSAARPPLLFPSP